MNLMLYIYVPRETLLFQYCNYVIEGSVQCAIGTRNPEMVVRTGTTVHQTYSFRSGERTTTIPVKMNASQFDSHIELKHDKV